MSETLRRVDPARIARAWSVCLRLLWNGVHLEGDTMITLDVLLLILALVCFLAAAANVSSPRLNLVAAGLALWITSLLF